MKTRFIVTTGIVPLCLAGLCGAAAGGRCDTTLTAQVSVTTGAAPSSPDARPGASDVVTATISFKGKMARLEYATGAVRIYDGAKGRVYTLVPAAKTYQTAALKDSWKMYDPILRFPPGTDYDVRLKLDKTDATQTEAGRTAQRYECIASVQPPAPEAPRSRFPGGRSRGGGGRRGGRGGFPGGFGLGPQATGAPGEAVQGRSYPGGRGRGQSSVQVAGELYLTGSALLPDGNQWIVEALVSAMVPRSPLLKPCVDRLIHMKMIPLASNLTFTFQNAGQPQDTVSIETHVKSISDAPIDDALFAVPADYHMSSAK